jgi:hypothetical protein
VQHVLLELAAASAVILLLQAVPWLPPAVRHVLYGKRCAGSGSKQVACMRWRAWQCHARTHQHMPAVISSFLAFRQRFPEMTAHIDSRK